jgi:putative ABC transport system ATP-binding protein
MGNNEVIALRRIDLAIKQKEFLAIKGPSGAGKSTLLHLIGGLDRPTNGQVIVRGIDLAEFSDDELTTYRKDYVGFVFQFFNLIPSLNALSNVLVSRMFEHDKGMERGKELLELVGLGDRMHHLPSELSGGEQQRVAIARALMNEPSILLADEPTGNVDTDTGREILKLFKKLNKSGTTIILVTHEDEIARYASRVVTLRDGKLQGKVPSKVTSKAPGADITKEKFNSKPELKNLKPNLMDVI